MRGRDHSPNPDADPERDPHRDRGSHARFRRVRDLLPGLALCLAIAGIASLIGRFVPVIGSAMPAIVLGAAIALIRRPTAILVPGVAFAGKRVLQLAVVLLGTQLPLTEVVSVGVESFPVMLSTLVVCLVAAWLLGRAMRVGSELTTLIGVGTGICGASAIAAVAPVIGASSSSIAYAVSTIFLFNVAAVLVFPWLGHLAGLDQHTFGLFAGTAVNDTSSVVATAAIYGSAALGFAVVVKLVRTLMIIPISVGLAVRTARRARRSGEDASPLTPMGVVRLVPWFLVGFLVASLLRTLGVVPESAAAAAGAASVFLIATAMAGIGLSVDVSAFRSAGLRPLLLGGLLWVVVTVTALLVIGLASPA